MAHGKARDDRARYVTSGRVGGAERQSIQPLEQSSGFLRRKDGATNGDGGPHYTSKAAHNIGEAEVMEHGLSVKAHKDSPGECRSNHANSINEKNRVSSNLVVERAQAESEGARENVSRVREVRVQHARWHPQPVRTRDGLGSTIL